MTNEINIYIENFGQPRLIIDLKDMYECDETKQNILQALKLQELVKSINWDEVTVNHYSKTSQKILDKLKSTQSLLEESEK